MHRTHRHVRATLALAAATLAAALAAAHPALAADCRSSGSFEAWLARFKAEALAQGISRGAIDAASPYLVYDQRIVNIDRGQRIFAQSFLEFSAKLLPADRLQQGAATIRKYQAIFERDEKQYGVPAAVITAFWGLESDFGTDMGKDHSIKSLTSLAYDCRRADMFRGHLFDALRLIQRGDLAPSEMIGSWAGELGQTQMMPSEYIKYAIDYDGDGKRNLLRSPADVIGSTANYLVSLGWKRGEPWLREVRVPATCPGTRPISRSSIRARQWAAWGVTLAGRPAAAKDSAGLAAAADGPVRPGVPGVRQFPGLPASGTAPWSIPPPPPITPPAWPAPRRCSAAPEPRRRRSPSSRRASCSSS